MVEHQPSKLRVAGSIPVSRSIGSTLRLPGLKARACSGLTPSTSLRASSERRFFTPSLKAGVRLSSRRSLGAVEWVKMIWLINFLFIWPACRIPLAGFSLFLAHVAQSVEHFLGKEEVIGSNPIVGSKEEVNFIIFLKNKEGLSHVEAEV